MFDYVIVGAGSAGCVLANRLTEDPRVSVLLLESGGPDQLLNIRIPAAFSKLFKTDYDWAYFTEEQPFLNGRKLYWPRGKGLGGSSSINAMIYIRGHRHDYDEWARLTGDPQWSFEAVQPYFKKAQHQQRGPDAYHGTGGPLHVADQRHLNPLSRAFVEAGVEVGLTRNPDFNGASQEGVGFYQVTQKDGQRHSAATAYLRPALRRPNLTVQTQAQASRLIIHNRQVVGLHYLDTSHPTHRQIEVRVRREVILAAGAINSPQLLLLSGIGPADQLRAIGIEPVLDLPGVGQNLQDHLAAATIYRSKQPISLATAESLPNIARFLLFRNGPLTSNVAEAGGFIKTRPDLPTPDIQYHFAPVIFTEHGLSRPQEHGYTIGPTLLHPYSRGHITLRSTNPLDPPLIQPNYLADPRDLQTLVEAIRLARVLGQTHAFDPFREAEILPGPAVQTDTQIADTLRSQAETLYHPVGTCKMGHDELAVVDSHLRVRGLAGLRVVDASIMPLVPTGNTNAPTIMIAERAADLIRQTPPLRPSRTSQPAAILS